MPDFDRHAEFTELLSRHHGQLYGYIFALIRNFNDTQDVLQQACLTMWEKYDEYDSDTSFIAWACVVARFKVLQFLEKQQRYQRQFSEQVQHELAALQTSISEEEADARRGALKNCLKKLPERQKALVLRCYEGVDSIREVAADLGRTPHSVHSSLRNIRRKLLECIDRTLATEGR